MIDLKLDPTPKEVRIFGLLWLLFFGAVAGIAWWKPEGLLGAAMFLGVAWIVSLLLNGSLSRLIQLGGITFPALFGGVGWVASRELVAWPSLATILGTVGGLGAVTVWLVPGIGKQLYVGWMLAAAPLGWTISHLVLGIVYYLVLTPIGVLMRWSGRDPMRRRLDPGAGSYWIRREREIDPARYFKQF